MTWKKFEKFATAKYWESRSKKNKVYQPLAIFISAIHSFINNQGINKGATLTFYSLFSIIPIIAIGFWIAQKLGFAEMFSLEIRKALDTQPAIAEKLIEFSNATLKKTRGGLIATFGIVLLFWTVLRMIANIESFFDQTWKVKKTRSFAAQLKYYIPLIILFPIFLVGSNSLIIFATTKTLFYTDDIIGLESIIYQLSDWAPLLLLALIFIATYKFLPHTKVPWKAAIISGIFIAIVFQAWQWIYINFQVNASSYGAIYGTFAAIPLFLIWLNYSWLIIIFGNELSYQISRK